jgi:poly-gamma-glutamate synthesis protein (capsule biosynthesis protein)
MQLLCLGDIALADSRLSNWVWSPPDGFVPDDSTKVLFNWELPVGNMLNPIPRSCGGPRLLSSPDSPGVIRSWAPGFAALATNHILDAGEDGLANTIKSLQQEGFITFGAGMTQEDINKPLIWETEEGKLVILNWVFPEANPDWSCVPGPNFWPGINEAKSIIRDFKHEVDWVMVLAHWSDELFSYPRPEDRTIARELVDAGMDLLVSHHPHVVRGMEVIRTCPVFYSLGNFYFSNFKNDSRDWHEKRAPRTRESLGLRISFKKGLKPEYKTLSFWQMNDRVIEDSRGHATKRMNYSSRPLYRFSGKEYETWYQSERSRFNKYWIKWHFGIRRMGVFGFIRKILHELQSLVQ